jgi:heme-degrading monooxygenase HmoA
MFVRKVSVRLKSNALRQFTNLMECEILPWLRTQEGFLELITLAGSGGCEIQVLSFWDHERNAKAFNTSGYTTVFRILDALLDGAPRVKTFEVVSSTLKEFSSHDRETGSVAPVGSVTAGGGSQEATV